MKVQFSNRYISLFIFFEVLFGLSCAHAATNNIVKLLPFSVTNRFAGGEFRQIIQITNNMTLYFTRSNIVIGFCAGGDTVIDFDPESRRPLSILLETPASSNQPAQSVLDINADGIPDIREIKDGTRTKQIFYHGEWFTNKTVGTHTFITIDGKEQRVHFDGQRWIIVSTNDDEAVAFTNHY